MNTVDQPHWPGLQLYHVHLTLEEVSLSHKTTWNSFVIADVIIRGLKIQFSKYVGFDCLEQRANHKSESELSSQTKPANTVLNWWVQLLQYGMNVASGLRLMVCTNKEDNGAIDPTQTGKKQSNRVK